MKNNIKLGIFCFAVGVILLIITFVFGYHFMTNESFYLTKKTVETEFIKNVTNWFIKSSTVLVALIIMTVIGSVFTDRGISLLIKRENFKKSNKKDKNN